MGPSEHRRFGALFTGSHLLWLWADTLHRLLDQLGLRPAYVAGVANGLLASMHFARRHPDDVRALVLIAALTDDGAWWQPVIDATFHTPEHARMLQHALPRSEVVNSAECHGSAWQDILNEAEAMNSFEYLAATLAGRIDTFIRALEERAGEPNLW